MRIKRAELFANQVQVWRGEPIAVHVPNREEDLWYVLSVKWQLDFVGVGTKKKRQHAAHAFDCMMIDRAALPLSARVADPAKDLRAACESAIVGARDPALRFVAKAISLGREAVAQALIGAFHEELLGR